MSETKKNSQSASKAKTPPIPAEKKQEILIYIGPDFPGVKQYTTYNAGLPDALKEKIEEHPFFNSLVVPVSKLAQASAELAQKGSALNIFYRKASENKKKRRDE